MFRSILILMFVLACSGSASAGLRRDDCSPKNIMGQVSKINMQINRLYVIDDLTKEEWDFFVHDNVLKSVKEGEYVRVYFNCPRFPAKSVEKMTPLEYKKGVQNKGYLLKQEENQ